MTQEQKVICAKVRMLELARQLENVSQVSRVLRKLEGQDRAYERISALQLPGATVSMLKKAGLHSRLRRVR
ncbi:hypothetical protein AAGS40_29735 (plasmid) [Paraburkholderia sp. PREW-6R]|uniref:hypothetical protein n=1 Tax=Paraburkholderia sp. PREW-6R TaxID=3141544 RepID=UPI0031F52BF3